MFCLFQLNTIYLIIDVHCSESHAPS